MVAKIRSISITKEQDDWLNEHTYINLSKIAQSAIDKTIENENMSATFKENEHLRQRLAAAIENMQKRAAFIDKKGLFDEYFREYEQDVGV